MRTELQGPPVGVWVLSNVVTAHYIIAPGILRQLAEELGPHLTGLEPRKKRNNTSKKKKRRRR